MARKWTISATGSALFLTALLIGACSGDDDSGDDDDDNNAGTGGTSATGGTAGQAGTGTGGSSGSTVTGGSSGSTATGGSSGSTATGGTGGASGSGGTAGTGTGGAGGMMGFECAGKGATCAVINDFPLEGSCWGSGDFRGGVSVFGGLTRDETRTDVIAVTGEVGGYGVGFNLWFAYCSDLSMFTGVSFKAMGTSNETNQIQFQLQTNSSYPWQPRPEDKKGACTVEGITDPNDAWSECLAPSVTIPIADTALTWAMMMGGDSPAGNGAWNEMTSPKEIIGIQFQFPWEAGLTPYMVNVVIDDVMLTGGDMTVCGPIGCDGTPAGTGGMGGMSGAGGDAGTAGSSAAGMAGMAGSGAGGMAGAAGSGAGGMAGSGGMGGRAGMGGAGAPGN